MGRRRKAEQRQISGFLVPKTGMDLAVICIKIGLTHCPRILAWLALYDKACMKQAKAK